MYMFYNIIVFMAMLKNDEILLAMHILTASHNWMGLWTRIDFEN